MGLFKTDEDTKDVHKEIDNLIRQGHPLVTKDGRKLYGKEAREALPTLAGDSVLDVLLSLFKDCM